MGVSEQAAYAAARIAEELHARIDALREELHAVATQNAVLTSRVAALEAGRAEQPDRPRTRAAR